MSLVGRGEPGETPIVEKALKSKDADLRVMALEAVFEAARRKPGAYKQVLARAAEDRSPAVHRRLLQAAGDLPAVTALAMARKSLDRKDAHGLDEAVKLAIKWSNKRPGEAAEILSAGAAGHYSGWVRVGTRRRWCCGVCLADCEWPGRLGLARWDKDGGYRTGGRAASGTRGGTHTCNVWASERTGGTLSAPGQGAESEL